MINNQSFSKAPYSKGFSGLSDKYARVRVRERYARARENPTWYAREGVPPIRPKGPALPVWAQAIRSPAQGEGAGLAPGPGPQRPP